MTKKKVIKKKPIKKHTEPLKIKEGSFNDVLIAAGKPEEKKTK